MVVGVQGLAMKKKHRSKIILRMVKKSRKTCLSDLVLETSWVVINAMNNWEVDNYLIYLADAEKIVSFVRDPSLMTVE